MKKASLLIAFLFCLASAQPNTCLSQSVAAGHWQLIRGDPFPDSVTQIVAGPGSLVYMATSDKGVFKSTDEGENWTQINTGLSGDLDITMLGLGLNGDLLARNDAGEILYSKDASTWTNDGIPWHSQFPNASATAFTFDLNGIPYIGTLGAGIYQMDTIGKWSQVVSPALIPGAQAMLFDNQDRLIVHFDTLYRLKSGFSAVDTSWPVTNTGNNPAQLVKTTLGSILVVSDTLYELTDQLQKISQNRVGGIVADSIGNLYAYYEADNVWAFMDKSTDRGVTWSTATIPSVSNIPYHGRFVEATSQGFITDGAGEPGLSVSFDTAFGFMSIHELDGNLRINEIDVDRFQRVQAFDAVGGIWASSDQGNTWRLRKPRQNIQGTLGEDGKYYVQGLSPMVSEDGGLTYRPVKIPTGIKGSLYPSPNGTLWLSYGSANFMRSFDGGVTWNEFAHFTDPAPAGFNTDSAFSCSVVERGPDIWLTTIGAIHFTNNDGATWKVDTIDAGLEGITGGRGFTIITMNNGDGFHWLGPGENVDSGWLQPNGNYVEDINGTMLQFTMQSPDTGEGSQVFIRESKSGDILDTLCIVPFSLGFPYYGGSDLPNQPGIAIDSTENIFAASFTGGLYRFIPATASVAQQPLPSAGLDVSVTNNMLTLTSPDEIQSAEMIDVTGRSLIEIPSSPSTMLSASVARIPSGFYFVKAVTAEGTIVRKVMIVR